MKKTNPLFNKGSEALLRKLKAEQQSALQEMQAKNAQKVQAFDDDYNATREQRIAEQEQALLQRYEAEFNMPRPENVPAPRLRTAAEIRAEARDRVERAYSEDRQKIIRDSRKEQENYIYKCLGIEPSEPSGRDGRDGHER